MDRNLNPHAEAIMARVLWSVRYVAGGGGQMDFYDSLTAVEKRHCRELVDRILAATWARKRAPMKGAALKARRGA